jgi:hypothetical protein
MADERSRLLRLRQLEAEQADARAKENAPYLRDAETGISQAQTEAAQAQAEAATALTAAKTNAAELATKLGAKIDPATGKIDVKTIPKTGSSQNVSGGGGKAVVSTYTDPTTGDVIAVYSDGTTAVLSKGTKSADAAAARLKAEQDAAAALEEKRRKGQSAFDLLFGEFERYGMGALVNDVKEFITQGLSRDELLLKLRATPSYGRRFSANEKRINAGLRALSEAEYIGLEDQYQNIMRNYGLPASYYTKGDMGVQPGFEKFIAGDVSATELEDRIQTAQNRVINAAPEVSKALREFYPDITSGDILAYALDPSQALTNIKRKVQAAEIGAGAMQAGLTTGLARAEELARFGVTAEQARQGYQTIGGLLPRASTLADIYKQGPYTQTTAEQEVFGTTGAVEAEKKRRQLAQLETAQFSGQTGMTGGALSRERAGQF